MAENRSNMSSLDGRIDEELASFFGDNLLEGRAETRPGVPFEAEVGTCKGVDCKGKIIYRLEWKQGSLPPNIPMGLWSVPLEQLLYCSCKRCGMLYDISHLRYRDVFEKAYVEFLKGV